ncbi:DUF4124 domain-containing protein [Solemya velesiana gill symbiont]|nr:DUF4124 domain-containing protein [Solemya velesiana gill symbiont]
MKKAALLLLLLLPFSLYSAVYKWVGPDGSVHYSDVPQKGSEEIELPEPTIYQPRLPGNGKVPGVEPEAVFSGYSKLAITSPKNEQVIRSNEGKVNVTLELLPELQQGHKFRVYLDGKEISSALTTTQLVLQNVERGGHTLSALVVDKESKERIRSNYVRFYLQKESELEGELEPLESEFTEKDQKEDASHYEPQTPVQKGEDRDEYKGDDPLPKGQEQPGYEGPAELPKKQEQPGYKGPVELPEGQEQPEYRGAPKPPPNSVNPGYQPVPKQKISPAYTPPTSGYKTN